MYSLRTVVTKQKHRPVVVVTGCDIATAAGRCGYHDFQLVGLGQIHGPLASDFAPDARSADLAAVVLSVSGQLADQRDPVTVTTRLYRSPQHAEYGSFGLSLGLTLSGLGLDLGLMASGLGLIEIGLVDSKIYSAHDIN